MDKRAEAAAYVQACAAELARRRPSKFLPWASPQLREPDHLPEMTAAFLASVPDPRSGREAVVQRVCFSASPQVGKSLVIVHSLLWYAWRVPGSVSAYVTYGTEPARARATEARQLLQRLPFLKATCNTERIRFANGSQIVFTSTDGPLESHAVTGWLVVDDPYKNPAEATSSVDRARIEGWFFGTAIGRIHESTSIMVCHHRWTEHDLIEKLRRHVPEPGATPWTYVNYPALSRVVNAATGAVTEVSVCPWLKSARFFQELRSTTLRSIWEAYYQGNPQPEGGRLFHGTHYYEPGAAFKDGFRVGIGIDCAYGDKRRGDWNAIVVLARRGRVRHVLEVQRSHESSPAFEARLKRFKARYPGAPIRWYPGSSEVGLAQRLAAEVGLEFIVATKNKKLRAERCAAAWNEDLTIAPAKPPLILVPRTDAPWLTDFLEEIHDFTGIEGQDLHDDQVDALASADDALDAPSSTNRVLALPEARGVGQWGGLVTGLH